MKTLLRIEEIIITAAAVYFLTLFNVAWWWYALMLIGPDVGMIGYLINSKLGAATYNIFHHRGIAIIIFIVGFTTFNLSLQLIGIVIFGHSSLDRVFGYGLKYSDRFKHTHLDTIT